MSISHDAAVEAFLADRPHLGLAPEVFAAEATAARVTGVPELEWRATEDQLQPDPREKAIEWTLAVAGDYGFTMDQVVTVLRGFRPDAEPADLREAAYHLYDLAAEVRRANLAGRTALEEHFAELYVDALADLAGAR